MRQLSPKYCMWHNYTNNYWLFFLNSNLAGCSIFSCAISWTPALEAKLSPVENDRCRATIIFQFSSTSEETEAWGGGKSSVWGQWRKRCRDVTRTPVSRLLIPSPFRSWKNCYLHSCRVKSWETIGIGATRYGGCAQERQGFSLTQYLKLVMLPYLTDGSWWSESLNNFPRIR